MAVSIRRSIVCLLLLLVAGAVALTYRGGYIAPVTLLADNALPVLPQPAIEDTIHIVPAATADAGSRRATSTEGVNVPVGWDADGSLLLVSDRIGRMALFAQSPGNEAARLLIDYAGMTGHARATPDGAAILFTVGPSLLSPSQRIMRFTLTGGEPEEVLSGNFIDGGARCARAPAMLCAIAERHDDGKHVIFSALNPASGRGRELARVEEDDFGELRWDLSPDGTRVAVADAKASQVRILLIGGPAAENISVSGAYGLGPVSFTRDSRGVIVPSVSAQGVTLWSISLRGTAQLLWEQPGNIDVAGMPSPDGAHIAVWVRSTIHPADQPSTLQ
jgi:Tol biopolymer transport system component